MEGRKKELLKEKIVFNLFCHSFLLFYDNQSFTPQINLILSKLSLGFNHLQDFLLKPFPINSFEISQNITILKLKNEKTIY